MRVLVTGASGFLGRHFVDALWAQRHQITRSDVVIGLDAMAIFTGPSALPLWEFDLVIHAAAQSPHRKAIDGNPGSLIYNRMLDAAMFDWAVSAKPGRVIYISSCAVLDKEPDSYGRLKLAGEEMAAQARAAGVDVTVVRPYSGYGEDQSADFPFGAFRDRAKAKADPFEIWNSRAVRDWIHVDDVVGASLALVAAGVDGPVSLCTGEGTSMADVAHMMCHQVGYCPELQVNPDGPKGVDRRVGDPTLMEQYYTPKVQLSEGIERAFRGE